MTWEEKTLNERKQGNCSRYLSTLSTSPEGEELAGRMAATEPPAEQIFGGDVSGVDGRASNRPIFASLPIESLRATG